MSQLAEEIRFQENRSVVRRLYLEKIASEICFLHLIEAVFEQNREQFWRLTCLRVAPPTKEEMFVALSYVKQVLGLASARSETADLSWQIVEVLSVFLPGLLDAAPEDPPLSGQNNQPDPLFEAAVVACFFDALFDQMGWGWRTEIDINASNARVDSGRRILVLQSRPITLTKIRHLIIHELGHVLRGIAGEQSLLGLLGIGTSHYELTEEGYLLYQERQLQGSFYDNAGQRLCVLGIGLASGSFGQPMGFYQLWKFLETFSMLPRLLKHPESDRQQVQEQAHVYALSLCLRLFRGVPHLKYPGVCNTKDVIYLRGLRMIEQAVSGEKNLLRQLAVGKVGLKNLHAVHTLGIQAPSSLSLLEIAQDQNLESMLRDLEAKV